MQVVEHEPHAWFLLRDGDTLLLDVNCSHGPVGYAWTMALTAQEVEQFRALGRDFIAQLAERVAVDRAGGLGQSVAVSCSQGGCRDSPACHPGYQGLDPGRLIIRRASCSPTPYAAPSFSSSDIDNDTRHQRSRSQSAPQDEGVRAARI